MDFTAAQEPGTAGSSQEQMYQDKTQKALCGWSSKPQLYLRSHLIYGPAATMNISDHASDVYSNQLSNVSTKHVHCGGCLV